MNDKQIVIINLRKKESNTETLIILVFKQTPIKLSKDRKVSFINILWHSGSFVKICCSFTFDFD